MQSASKLAFRLLALGVAIIAGAFAQGSSQRALLLLSIDGLRPDYVTDPAHASVKIPNLRRLMQDGAYASGVRGVLPSSTYPSHTTLVTGVHPARHGILSNRPFFPFQQNANGWYWFSEDIRVPTLWDAAAKGGYVTGSVSWPVTVGAPSIQHNLPEYAGSRTDEDIKMVRALAGAKLFDGLRAKAGPYVTDVNHDIKRDWVRTRYAVEMIRQKHTRFITVHLAALDHQQHEHTHFSPQAIAALEEIDRMLGELQDAIRAEDPAAAVCVVSDHGFIRVEKVLKLDAAFVNAGLITLRTKRESLGTSAVSAWEAMSWSSGGSAAIMLREPNDAVRARVKALLESLAADPANGIASVMDSAAFAPLGGTSLAAFWVDMRPGFALSGALDGPPVAAVSARGSHGYSPAHPDINSSFFIAGRGIRKMANLGEVDMRSIAPTLAAVMGIPFTTADGPALPIFDAATVKPSTGSGSRR